MKTLWGLLFRWYWPSMRSQGIRSWGESRNVITLWGIEGMWGAEIYSPQSSPRQRAWFVFYWRYHLLSVARSFLNSTTHQFVRVLVSSERVDLYSIRPRLCTWFHPQRPQRSLNAQGVGGGGNAVLTTEFNHCVQRITFILNQNN